jgi:hypothetical protein
MDPSEDLAPPDGDLPATLRPVLFCGSVLMLDLLRTYSKALALDAESIWILLYVTQQSMQPFLLDPDQARAWSAAPVVADEVRGWVSRRAVAEGTGLPRETVRRKMAALCRDGLLVEDEFGRIRVRSDGWETDYLQDFADQISNAVNRYERRLAMIGDFIGHQ